MGIETPLHFPLAEITHTDDGGPLFSSGAKVDGDHDVCMMMPTYGQGVLGEEANGQHASTPRSADIVTREFLLMSLPPASVPVQ